MNGETHQEQTAIRYSTRVFASLSVQVGLRKHLQELPAAALVDAHGQQPAVTSEKERPRNSRNVEGFVHLPARIENEVRVVFITTNELRHFDSVLVGDGQDDEPL